MPEQAVTLANACDCSIIIVCVSLQVAVVTQQPMAPVVMEIAAKPKNYLALSIVNMLCCCFILGLIALIFSLQVRYDCMCGVRYNDVVIALYYAMAWHETGNVMTL
jgi:hypothetical protein